MTLPGETISSGAPDHNADPNVSKLQVLMSAAGYYIGTTYYEDDIDCEVPNTRESSCYYATYDEAHRALASDTYPRR